METDARAQLAETLWPSDPSARGSLDALIDAEGARRLNAIVRLLSADGGAVAALRRFRWEARRHGGSSAFSDLKAGLEARYQRGVPRGLFGDQGMMTDPRTGARILVAVLRRRRRGREVVNPLPGARRIPASGGIVAAVREVLDRDDGPFVRAALLQALGDPDWHVRVGAIRIALGFLGHDQVRRALARMVVDEIPAVRAVLVRGLGRRAGRGRVDAILREALHDPDAVVRRRAVEAAADSRVLISEIGLTAFDPDPDVRAAARAVVGDAGLRAAVEDAIDLVRNGADVPLGVLRVVVREAGLDRDRLSNVLRRRIVRLVRSGQSRALVDTVRALAWLGDAPPALQRLTRYAMAAPNMDRPCFALIRSWYPETAFAVGCARLRHAGNEGASLRMLVVQEVVRLAAELPHRREQVLIIGYNADEATAAGVIWEAARAFPAEDVAAYLPAYETRPEAGVIRACKQVRASVAGDA